MSQRQREEQSTAYTSYPVQEVQELYLEQMIDLVTILQESYIKTRGSPIDNRTIIQLMLNTFKYECVVKDELWCEMDLGYV